MLMGVRFRDSTGGYGYSDAVWYNVLKIVEDFVGEVYGVERFFETAIDTSSAKPVLLKEAHRLVHEKWKLDQSIMEERPQTSIFDWIDNLEQFSVEECERQLLPLVEAAFVWNQVKKAGGATTKFRQEVATSISRGDTGSFYGYLFEAYVAGIYVYDRWVPVRPSDAAPKSEEGRLDWVFKKGERMIGIECKDKRMSLAGGDNPTWVGVADVVRDARSKFPSWAGKLDRRLVFVNLTRPDYVRPTIQELGVIRWEGKTVGRFEHSFDLASDMDGVVLYWREKSPNRPGRVFGNGFTYTPMFALAGTVDERLDLPVVWPVVRLSLGRHLTIRMDMENPPYVSAVGPVESAHDYYNERIVSLNNLVGQIPDDEWIWVDSADSFAEWADHLLACGEYVASRSAFREAGYRYEIAAMIGPQPTIHQKWGTSLERLAHVLAKNKEWDTAKDTLKESATKYNLATKGASRPEAYYGWARVLRNLGHLAKREGNTPAALALYEDACHRFREACREGFNERHDAYHEWGNTLRQEALLLEKTNRPRKVVSALEEACFRYSQSVDLRKHWRVYLDWGMALNSLARIVYGRGTASRCWPILLEACSKYDKAAEIAPSESVIYENWREALAGLAVVLYARGDRRSDWLVLIEELKRLIRRERWLPQRPT